MQNSGVSFLLSGAMVDALFNLWGLNHWVCNIAAFRSLPIAGIYATW